MGSYPGQGQAFPHPGPGPMPQDATAVRSPNPTAADILLPADTKGYAGGGPPQDMLRQLSEEELLGLEQNLTQQIEDMQGAVDNPREGASGSMLGRSLAQLRAMILEEYRGRVQSKKENTMKASDGRPILEHLLDGTKPPNR